MAPARIRDTTMRKAWHVVGQYGTESAARAHAGHLKRAGHAAKTRKHPSGGGVFQTLFRRMGGL